MIDLLWGRLDGYVAIFVALLNAIWGTEFGFFDPERAGAVWYRLGFLFGTSSMLGSGARLYRGRHSR